MDSVGIIWKIALIIAFWLNYHLIAGTTILLGIYTCEIPVWDLQDTKYGIILEPNPWKLKVPLEGFFKWENNKPIYIGCGNEIRRITCSSKTKAQDFICKTPPYVDFSTNKKSCAKIGTQYQIGFTINNSEFIPYYDVCYNNNDCSVIYSYHQLLGDAFNRLSRTSRADKSFVSFSCKITYNTFYLQSNQRRNSRIHTTPNQYLQRGHLFPDRDAPVYSWKLATFSYGNCAPEWKTINSDYGNWFKLEEMVSVLAINKSIKFDIYDGVLYNPIPQNKIYLNQTEAMIEVPQWFYKVVINRNRNVIPGYSRRILEEEMIFFVYNDPYSSPAAKFCSKNLCADYSWTFDDDQVKGKTHCCLHKDLKKDTLPEEVMKAFGDRSTGLYFFKRPRGG